jgi:hypothetical protein
MSRTLQATIDWATTFVNYLPLNVGTSNQPAIDNANNVKQLFISPELKWNWNRNTKSFQTVIGQQDYAQTGMTDFGFLETASFQPCATITNVAGDGTTATITAPNAFVKGNTVTITGLTHTAFNVTNAVITSASATQFQFASTTTQVSTTDAGLAVSGQIQQIADVLNSEPIAESSDPTNPHTIAVQTNDNAGNITFRLLGVPPGTFNIILNYQKAATLFTALTGAGGTWSPIPDHYAYIYNRGFLAETLEPVDATRAQIEKQRFIMSLVSVAEGLELADKAIFMAQYLGIDAATAANMLNTQQGTAAKAQR